MSVRIEQLYYRFKGAKSDALSGISLDIRPGEILGLIGPDGAGKTTLLRLAADVFTPKQGSVALPPGRRVGYMPQRFSLYEDLSIAENLELQAGLQKIPSREADERAEKLLQVAGFLPFKQRLAGKLSGGMKQKLALICTMLAKPDFLLLDEPGVGVDPVSRRELWKLAEQNRAAGVGIVWATAYMDEAQHCDRICVLHRGKIIFLGTPEAFLAPLRGRVFSKLLERSERLSALKMLRADFRTENAALEGENVRFVLREKSSSPIPDAVPVEPSVEEAFLHVCGATKEKSFPAENFADDAGVPAPKFDATETVIVTENLTKRFGDFVATDKLSLRIRRGEIFGILGANGAGKTTAFRMICGLLPPSEGKAKILGIDLKKDPRRAREQIGYMAQKFSLYGSLDVLQNLNFFASIYGLRGNKKRERIADSLHRFELSDYATTKAGTLPTGIKQRLSMACATLHNPPFLFLDEPTSGVDPFVRRAFWEEINAMSARGVTIVVTTHFMDEAQYLHRMVIMNAGKVIAAGTPEELKKRAASADFPSPTMEQAFIHFAERKGANA